MVKSFLRGTAQKWHVGEAAVYEYLPLINATTFLSTGSVPMIKVRITFSLRRCLVDRGKA